MNLSSILQLNQHRRSILVFGLLNEELVELVLILLDVLLEAIIELEVVVSELPAGSVVLALKSWIVFFWWGL